MARAGLRANAVYLVRPDGYIATVEPEATAGRIGAYLDERHIASFGLSASRSPNGWRGAESCWTLIDKSWRALDRAARPAGGRHSTGSRSCAADHAISNSTFGMSVSAATLLTMR